MSDETQATINEEDIREEMREVWIAAMETYGRARRANTKVQQHIQQTITFSNAMMMSYAESFLAPGPEKAEEEVTLGQIVSPESQIVVPK